MSEHAEKWLKEKEALHVKEEKVRQELNVLSGKLEGAIKLVLIFSAVMGVTYIVFRLTSRKSHSKQKESPTEEVKTKTLKVETHPSIGQLMLEKALLAMVQFAGKQILEATRKRPDERRAKDS